MPVFANSNEPLTNLHHRVAGARGYERLSADNSSEALRSNMEKPAKPAGKKDSKGEQAEADVSRALRSVYDDTLQEEVPDDFLDLLGKLQ